jgi:hypothetical protein
MFWVGPEIDFRHVEPAEVLFVECVYFLDALNALCVVVAVESDQRYILADVDRVRRVEPGASSARDMGVPFPKYSLAHVSRREFCFRDYALHSNYKFLIHGSYLIHCA